MGVVGPHGGPSTWAVGHRATCRGKGGGQEGVCVDILTWGHLVGEKAAKGGGGYECMCVCINRHSKAVLPTVRDRLTHSSKVGLRKQAVASASMF